MKRTLLIIEPDLLTRWSLQTYLAPWFDISTATEQQQACCLAAQCALDALIVSDAIPEAFAEAVEREARNRNPAVRIVRTVSGPGAEKHPPETTAHLEEPFDLHQLGSVLGVNEPLGIRAK